MYARLIISALCCLVLAASQASAADKATRQKKKKKQQAASAQQQTAPVAPLPPPLTYPTVPPPPVVESGPDYRHASTAYQGYADGLARLTRAEAMAAYNYQLAAMAHEQARDAALRNELTEQSVRQQIREQGCENRRAKRGPPITHEQAARIARMRAPKQLSVRQLDIPGGQIDWPAGLQGTQFAYDRERLEAMFLDVALDQDEVRYDQVKEVTDRMIESLMANQKQLPSERYLEARTFLTSLTHSVRSGATARLAAAMGNEPGR